MLKRDAEQSLRDTLLTAIPSEFFQTWFKTKGQAYYFVFAKNLRVTNLQHAELLALIREHVSPPPNEGLLFSTTRQFQDHLAMLIRALGQSDTPDVACVEKILELYGRSMLRTAIYDPFFGGAAVFLPGWLDLDLRAICGQSGYIHSAGRNVFIRRVSKAEPLRLKDLVREHVERYYTQARRAFLVVYSHEDFSKYDDERRSALRHGLEDLKLYVEKFHVGGMSLVEWLQSLRDDARIEPLLRIARPGPYKCERARVIEEGGIDTTRTIWLIVDRELGSSRLDEGERFFICYDQQYRSCSPFQVFDENKPAWIDHTTMPHSMCAALLNVTKPWSTHSAVVRAADPFAGSGTLGLEGIKEPQLAPLDLADINPSCATVARDNLWWLSRGGDEIAEATTAYESRARGFLEGDKPTAEDCLQRIGALERDDFVGRLPLYIWLRALRRKHTAIMRESQDWNTAYSDEAARLLAQIDELRELRDREMRSESTTTHMGGVFSIAHGEYSFDVIVAQSHLRRIWDATAREPDAKEPAVWHRSAVDLSLEATTAVHLVITDPPYGFNTSEAPMELAKLYVDFVRTALRRIRPGGHLIVCLLERSHIGKGTWGFASPEAVAATIIAAAQENGRSLYLPLDQNPSPGWVFDAPYYWESERALRRSILHLRVR